MPEADLSNGTLVSIRTGSSDRNEKKKSTWCLDLAGWQCVCAIQLFSLNSACYSLPAAACHRHHILSTSTRAPRYPGPLLACSLPPSTLALLPQTLRSCSLTQFPHHLFILSPSLSPSSHHLIPRPQCSPPRSVPPPRVPSAPLPARLVVFIKLFASTGCARCALRAHQQQQI